MKFKFKSTGKDIADVLSDQEDAKIAASAIPIGIMTPLRHSRDRAGVFEMHYNIVDQVSDNLRNLIQTNHGERLGRPGYGANLRPLSIELMGQKTFESEAMKRISSAVGKYLPFVSLKTMTVHRLRDNETELPQVIIRLEYDVQRLGKRKILDVIVTLAG
jgi:phage baseplate assembly protein W